MPTRSLVLSAALSVLALASTLAQIPSDATPSVIVDTAPEPVAQGKFAPSWDSTFAWIGSYAAYLTPQVFETHFPTLSADVEATNDRIRLLWLGVGKADFLYQEAIAFNAFLAEKDIRHVALVTEGGHTWMNARHYLAETLQRFFK
jgi:enterochelin esterase-like enzyme